MSTMFYFMSDDSLVPPVPIDLDRRRHVKLGKRAIFRAEKALCQFWEKRLNILTVLFSADGLTMNDVAILLWQGLLHEDPSLTLEQVQSFITLENLTRIVEAIYQAWNDASKPVDGVAEVHDDDRPLATVSPGIGSGLTPVLS